METCRYECPPPLLLVAIFPYNMFGKKKPSSETLVREGNFMTKPEKGWLHNDSLLAHGQGVYYCFPVRVRKFVHTPSFLQYIGSLQVLASLNALSLEQKTELCRLFALCCLTSSEAIARCVEEGKIRKKIKRKPQKYFKEYIAGAHAC